MMGAITFILSGLGRRAALYAALTAAIAIAAWLLIRRGRFEAEAALAIRRAEARIRAMQTAREIRHDTHNTDCTDLDARADRWMRD